LNRDPGLKAPTTARYTEQLNANLALRFFVVSPGILTFAGNNLGILVDLVIFDSGLVFLELLLLSWYPPREVPRVCGLSSITYKYLIFPTNRKICVRLAEYDTEPSRGGIPAHVDQICVFVSWIGPAGGLLKRLLSIRSHTGFPHRLLLNFVQDLYQKYAKEMSPPLQQSGTCITRHLARQMSHSECPPLVLWRS
jgi:hypothetical protein